MATNRLPLVVAAALILVFLLGSSGAFGSALKTGPGLACVGTGLTLGLMLLIAGRLYRPRS